MDDIKDGCLIGTDIFGNKYFENNRYFFGRNRWVEYPRRAKLQYDATQVPAEWFGWLHYKTDCPPCMDPARPNYKWMLQHTENSSGTRCQYYPYSTTRPKIEVWMPKIKCRY